MIEHSHLDQCQCLLEPLGKQSICLARFRHARGVVVHQNHRRRILRQTTFDHLARVDTGTVDAAMEQRFEFDHPVFGIEEQAAKHLVGLMAQARLEVVAHRLRAFQYGVAAQPLGQMAPAHLQYRLQLGIFRWPKAKALTESRQVRLKQRPQTAEVIQQVPSQIDRALPGNPGTQENRQQLGIGQCRRPQVQQFLPRTLRRRPIANTHDISLSLRPAVPLRTLCYLSPTFLRGDWPGEASSPQRNPPFI